MSVSECTSFYGQRRRRASLPFLQKVRLADGSVMRLDRRLSAADVVAASMLFAAGQFANTLRVNTALDIPFAERRQSMLRGTKHPQGKHTHNAVQPRHD